MTAKTVVLIVLLLCIASGGPGLLGESVAAPVPIPGYFDGERIGLLCVTAVPAGSPPGFAPIPVLVQFNFDHVTQGGISLNRANRLFGYFEVAIRRTILSPALGLNPERCGALTPGVMQFDFPGVHALNAAQQLAGTFQQLGFQRYYIVDVYLATYALDVESIVRAEVFHVVGADALSYVQGLELSETLLQDAGVDQAP